MSPIHLRGIFSAPVDAQSSSVYQQVAASYNAPDPEADAGGAEPVSELQSGFYSPAVA